jgi:predicted metal-binding membrane protein
MTSVAEPRIRLPITIPAAIALAWVLVAVTAATGNGTGLHNHQRLIEGGPSLWAALALFVLSWQVMVAAMMLPSSLPLIRLFAVASRGQARPRSALVAFLAGYAAVWTAFGAAAFLGNLLVHRTLDSTPWLGAHPWFVTGALLATAGVFQYSKLKERCLDECRHPAAYLTRFYGRGVGAAFRLGRGHGLFCLGCCWALMLLMFGVGIAALWWMAALTALMVYEKVGRQGATAARVAGVALLGAAALEVAHPAWLPTAFGGPRSFSSDVMIGPGTVTRTLRASGYQLELNLNPNKATRSGTVSLTLLKAKRPINNARISATFTMLEMDMGHVSTRLPQTGPGTYGRPGGPVLGMAGRWALRFEIAPLRAKPFAVSMVDQVTP